MPISVMKSMENEYNLNIYPIGRPLKVLFIVGEFPALSETFILNQIEGLLARGHKVEVYATKPRNNEILINRPKKHQFPEKIYYSYTPSRFKQRLFNAPIIFQQYGIKNIKTLIRTLNFIKFGRSAFSFKLMYKAAPMLVQKRYDIVQCHFGPYGNQAVMLKRLGILHGKIITTFHGYDITASLKIYGENYYYNLFKYGDHFLPISNFWKKKLISLGCDSSKISVHKMGVDCDKFNFEPCNLPSNGKIRIISIARLTEKKGIYYGIHAVAKLLENIKNIEYIIVGDGPLRKDLADLIVSLDVKNYVKLLGWRSHNEVAKLLRNSHILLAPSVTADSGDQEGIPVVLMEAMAMGIPIVSTLHSGIPELIKDEESGFLVSERNPIQLADRLEYLIKHPGILPEMLQKGRQTVTQLHDNNKLNDELVEIYYKILDSF